MPTPTTYSVIGPKDFFGIALHRASNYPTIHMSNGAQWGYENDNDYRMWNWNGAGFGYRAYEEQPGVIGQHLRAKKCLRTFGPLEQEGAIMITMIGLGFLMVVIGAVKVWWELSD